MGDYHPPGRCPRFHECVSSATETVKCVVKWMASASRPSRRATTSKDRGQVESCKHVRVSVAGPRWWAVRTTAGAGEIVLILGLI
ncbi:unnamed protein product [Acanthoscelides obtectus]|uniref:Uncharacterized protein n=1 Tax=Acanthoscelides obtectus TaxID=200917 RepID=A0A9P0NST5_ACAOB|nr:unnamed protein product [Acanthoscelides obtectus]CAK1678484.1 hypothetical protein AOBTE_LOCUS31931 [Acanthoscelides obtectus]